MSTNQFNEEIEQQQMLLATYRRTLAHLLLQAAQHGGEIYAPPAISNGIQTAREHVQQIKAILRSRHVVVDDLPGDEPLPPQDVTRNSPAAITSGNRVEDNTPRGQGMFISGGTIYGPIVGTNTGTVTTTYGGSFASGSLQPALEQVMTLIRQAAQQRGDSDVADDLNGVVYELQGALRAEQANKAERRLAKLQSARERLRLLVDGNQDLQPLVDLLDKLA